MVLNARLGELLRWPSSRGLIMVEHLPILTFHDLDQSGSVISFAPDLFRNCMAWLQDSGWKTLSLADVMACLESGRPFPSRALVLTFDDGYRSVYEVAFPVLQRLGMTATVFLTVGERGTLPPLNGRPVLSWAEVRAMAGRIDFGAHTLTHPDLTRTPPDQLEVELRLSRTILEDALGRPVETFAYPFGRFDDRTRAAVARYYRIACTDRLERVGLDSDSLTLPRVDAYYLRSWRRFRWLGSAVLPWYLRARAGPRRLRRWLAGAARVGG